MTRLHCLPGVKREFYQTIYSGVKLETSPTKGTAKRKSSISGQLLTPNISLINSQKSNTVCGIFSILWMTFVCRWGVSRFAVIYESTLPCVTDLSMRLGLAQGSLSGLPGVSDRTSLSAWGCVRLCYRVCVCVCKS